MNTIIHYQYRDGDNYKRGGSWIVTGGFTPEQEAALRAACMKEDDSDFFVPETVGIPQIEFADGWDEQSDHGFCTIEELEETTADAQDPRTVDELTTLFATRDWEADGAAFALERAE